jgi:FlaA1/EpsC-like NDP-sugar epimerase
MATSDVLKVINRPEGVLETGLREFAQRNPRVLITGASGSIGKEIQLALTLFEIDFLATDIQELDVTDSQSIESQFGQYEPSHVLHLAADKHAPAGEDDPIRTISINIDGTKNIVEACSKYKSTLILSSTCKSCDPETVYGASKLIAERLVLNGGGRVARFFNVVETSDNVFELWAKVPHTEDLVVTPCYRYFITLEEAVSLVLRVLRLENNEQGNRFIFHPGEKQSMYDIAKRLYPDRRHLRFPPRRGDRLEEPLIANSEVASHVEGNLYSVTSPHDLAPTATR